MSLSGLVDDGRAEPANIGDVLRAAREAAGYSIEDVASRMRLSRDQIGNMETERFDRFPVAVFLRGYLTSYARLLELDPEPLLEAYDRKGFGPPRLHYQGTAGDNKSHGSELAVTITTLIVVAILITTVVLWWRENWSGGDDGLSSAGQVTALPDPSIASPGAEDGPAEPVPFPAAPGSSGGLEGPEGAGRDGSPTPSADPAPSVAGSAESEAGVAVDDSGAGAPSGERRASPDPDGFGGTRADPPEANRSASASREGAPAAAETSVPGRVRGASPAAGRNPAEESVAVVIRVRDNCWLMIRDAEDRLIYRDLAVAGEVLELSGIPPIHVVAGYAKGIDVEFDGEPFDLSPHMEPGTDTARFRLGS